MGLENWKGEGEGEGDDWTSFLEGVNTDERQGQEMEE